MIVSLQLSRKEVTIFSIDVIDDVAYEADILEIIQVV
jgi:hypothetical protein